jgi:hypothetical protein
MKPAEGGASDQRAQSQSKPNSNEENSNQSASKNSGEAQGPATAQKGSEQGGTNKTAQDTRRDMTHGGKNDKSQNRAAKNIDQGRKAALGEKQQQGGRSTAQREESRSGSRSTAQSGRGDTAKTAEKMQRNGRLKGLQANASANMSGNVKITEQQRTQIRNEVIDARAAPRVGHVDFDLRVGTLVPRRQIHVVPVPETLVRIEPRWHGYLYFVYEDQVIIVNPRDMRIVAVLDV